MITDGIEVTKINSRLSELSNLKVFVQKHFMVDYEKIKKEVDINFFLYKKIIKKGDWCLDIGANIGVMSLIMASCCGKEGKVISIEPSDVAFCVLEYNTKMNSEYNFNIYNLGLSNVNEKSVFAFSITHDNGKLLKDESVLHKDDVGTIYKKVTCRKPIEFLNENYFESELKKIKFIKIDTEGSDYIILRELMPFIKKNRPTIMVEKFEDSKILEMLHREMKKVKALGYNIQGFETTGEGLDKDIHDYILTPNT